MHHPFHLHINQFVVHNSPLTQSGIFVQNRKIPYSFILSMYALPYSFILSMYALGPQRWYTHGTFIPQPASLISISFITSAETLFASFIRNWNYTAWNRVHEIAILCQEKHWTLAPLWMLLLHCIHTHASNVLSITSFTKLIHSLIFH